MSEAFAWNHSLFPVLSRSGFFCKPSILSLPTQSYYFLLQFLRPLFLRFAWLCKLGCVLQTTLACAGNKVFPSCKPRGRKRREVLGIARIPFVGLPKLSVSNFSGAHSANLAATGWNARWACLLRGWDTKTHGKVLAICRILVLRTFLVCNLEVP